MIIMRYFHQEEELHIRDRVYRATCKVRNEINGKRAAQQIVETYPRSDPGDRRPYMPRKMSTGFWKEGKPIWTDDPIYWPVKIPTGAIRQVMTWDTRSGRYEALSGIIQDDSYYHLHFSRDSITTLGCIRLDSERDAREIAQDVERLLDAGNEIWIEVFANKE